MKNLIFFLFLVFSACSSKKTAEPLTPLTKINQDGISFEAFTQVDPQAIPRAQYVVQQMLKNSPETKKKMLDSGFTIEIIGQNQKLSDIPRYRDLKDQKTFDRRSFDSGTRGVGGVNDCSVGEENLLCATKQMYWEEDILIHEFAHSIKSNMPEDVSRQIDQAYEAAKTNHLYPADIYMMANSQEYWAEATQSWFGATTRLDVNGGINSRAALIQHDPQLSKILKLVYGVTEISRIDNCRY